MTTTNKLFSFALPLLAVATFALTGCASTDDSPSDDAVEGSEDEFNRGDVYVSRAPFLAEEIDNRPPPRDRGDVRCWRADPPKTLKCRNEPLPQTDVGVGQLVILTPQARTEGQALIFDVQVRHPSFDGKTQLTRTFRGVRFVNEAITYGSSEWRHNEKLVVDGLTYSIAFTFKNDGFIRDVFEERLTRSRVEVRSNTHFMTMTKDRR